MSQDKTYTIFWQKGSKSGRGYVHAKDIVEAQQKAVGELFICQDDILEIRECEDKSVSDSFPTLLVTQVFMLLLCIAVCITTWFIC
jgi:hypothetical protein